MPETCKTLQEQKMDISTAEDRKTAEEATVVVKFNTQSSQTGAD